MKTVLFFTDMHAGVHATEYAGVCDRARHYGWRVVEIEYARTDRPAEEFIEEWDPCGVIVECGNMIGEVNVPAYTSVPAVFIDPRLPAGQAGRLFTVEQDAAALAALAYRELSAIGPATFGFVGWCGRQIWSERRQAAFAEILRRHGAPPLQTFDTPWSRTDLLSFRRHLARWLTQLPRPCAILAANDETAERVAEACTQSGLACPDDVAIIGADNDSVRCENHDPQLSSIASDYLNVGRLAADLLAGQLHRGAKPAPRTVTFGPTEIVRRDSTRTLQTRDPTIQAALRKIARDACEGLTAADILADIPCSRRLAEQRFRAAVGHSIGEEIMNVRLARVRKMLADPSLPIARIAPACGWETESFLKRAFKRRTGLTMREWRDRLAALKSSTAK